MMVGRSIFFYDITSASVSLYQFPKLTDKENYLNGGWVVVCDRSGEVSSVKNCCW